MKTIYWFGGAVLIAAGAFLTSFLAGAAVGDVVVLKSGDVAAISGAQKVALGNCIQDTFPNAQLANVVEYQCQRRADGEVGCRGAWMRTVSSSDFADLAAEGEADFVGVSVSGDDVTFKRRSNFNTTNADAKTCLKNFTENVFSSQISGIGALREFICVKVGADVNCQVAYLESVSPIDFATAVQNGDDSIIKAVGRVQ